MAIANVLKADHPYLKTLSAIPIIGVLVQVAVETTNVANPIIVPATAAQEKAIRKTLFEYTEIAIVREICTSALFITAIALKILPMIHFVNAGIFLGLAVYHVISAEQIKTKIQNLERRFG